MKNAFQNVDAEVSTIKSQQLTSNGIDVKGKGRPKKPNMVKKLIKVDKVLYAQIGQLADREHTTIAAIISRALKKELL